MRDKICPFCDAVQSSDSLFCSQCSNPLEENISVFSRHKTTIIITALATMCACLIAVMIGFSGRQAAIDSPTATVSGSNSEIKTLVGQTDLKIKGNKNSKIYHLPGCPNYNDIAERNIVWFKTHEEAKAAGFRMARNC